MSKSRVLKSIVFAALAVSSVAVAATTGTVTLGGTVAANLLIVSTPTGTASALDLTPGQKLVLVSVLTMSTNNEQGFRLTATSGNLTKAGGTSIAFKVTSVDATTTAPVAGDFTVASGTSYTVDSGAQAGSDDQDLYILYTPAALQDPGNYSGSIGLTVTDL